MPAAETNNDDFTSEFDGAYLAVVGQTLRELCHAGEATLTNSRGSVKRRMRYLLKGVIDVYRANGTPLEARTVARLHHCQGIVEKVLDLPEDQLVDPPVQTAD